MRFIIVLILVSILSVSTIAFFVSLGEIVLGLILSAIMFVWPIGFWALSRVGEGWSRAKAEDKPAEQEMVEKPKEAAEPPKKDMNALRDNLLKLKKVSVTLDDERRQDVISQTTYDELKKQNDEAIARIERELKD